MLKIELILFFFSLITFNSILALEDGYCSVKCEVLCRDGWVYHNNACYFFDNTRLPWYEAEDLCKSLKSHLVDIRNQKENDFIAAHINGDTWTSGNDIDDEGYWKWHDHFAINFTSWRKGHPSSYFYHEDCLALSRERVFGKAEWYDDACDHKRPFVCKYYLDTEKKSSSVILDTLCKDGWSLYREACYFFSSDKITWEEARIRCEEETSHLVDVIDGRENDFVHEYMSDNVWTSAQNYQFNGEWYWYNKKPIMYGRWEQNEPSNAYNENCMKIMKKPPYIRNSLGSWKVSYCSEKKKFVCKYQTGSVCRSDWLLFKGACYFFSEEEKPWEDADGTCRKLQSHLADIRDKKEDEFLQEHIIDEIWTGGNDRKKEWQWRWHNDQIISFTKWDEGEPWNSNDRDCISVKKGGYLPSTLTRRGGWNDANCLDENFYVCKYRLDEQENLTLNAEQSLKLKKEEKIEVAPLNDKRCRLGWRFFKQSCYLFPEEKKSWRESYNTCENQESHLVDILDGQENDFVLRHITEDSWTSGNDLAFETHFMWHNGNPIFYTRWANGQPDNAKEEDCIMIRKKGLNWLIFAGSWNDAKCTEQKTFVCKYKADETFKESDQDNEEEKKCRTKGLAFASNRVCKDGWMMYDNACYWFSKDKLIWEESKSVCKDFCSHLVDILNKNENDFLLANMYSDIWTSGNDIKAEGNWKWHNGKQIHYKRWEYVEPSNFQGENCMAVMKLPYKSRYFPGGWNDANCESKKRFVCKYQIVGDEWCRGDWKSYKKACYYFHKDHKSWDEASLICATYSAHLVDIQDNRENEFVVANLLESLWNNEVWTSGNDKKNEGEWQWYNEDPIIYTNWENKEPNNFNNEEHCLLLKKEVERDETQNIIGGWNDLDCLENNTFVCKYQLD